MEGRMRTVKDLVERYGYSQEKAEQEVARANCKHNYGKMCESTFLGCVRTCQKCGQKMCIPGGCTKPKAKT